MTVDSLHVVYSSFPLRPVFCLYSLPACVRFLVPYLSAIRTLQLATVPWFADADKLQQKCAKLLSPI